MITSLILACGVVWCGVLLGLRRVGCSEQSASGGRYAAHSLEPPHAHCHQENRSRPRHWKFHRAEAFGNGPRERLRGEAAWSAPLTVWPFISICQSLHS
jgi:hypothetical protein